MAITQKWFFCSHGDLSWSWKSMDFSQCPWQMAKLFQQAFPSPPVFRVPLFNIFLLKWRFCLLLLLCWIVLLLCCFPFLCSRPTPETGWEERAPEKKWSLWPTRSGSFQNMGINLSWNSRVSEASGADMLCVVASLVHSLFMWHPELTVSESYS